MSPKPISPNQTYLLLTNYYLLATPNSVRLLTLNIVY